MNKIIEFLTILNKTQKYISENYAAVLTNDDKLPQLKSYIEKYLRDTGLEIEGLSLTQLTDNLYREMAEYSILTNFSVKVMLKR